MSTEALTHVLPPLGVDLGLDSVEQFGEPLDERLFPPSAAGAQFNTRILA